MIIITYYNNLSVLGVQTVLSFWPGINRDQTKKDQLTQIAVKG